MGKSKPKPKGNGRMPAEKPPGCYVLSLSVENVRCFGPKQTLDCSDGNGRPRQWTVILGDNGSGKTTLLQARAGHEWVERKTSKGDDLDPAILLYSSAFIRHSTDGALGRSELRAVRQSDLCATDGQNCEGSWGIRLPLSSGYRSNLHDFVVHGYGPKTTARDQMTHLCGRFLWDRVACAFRRRW
jgi:AAA domain